MISTEPREVEALATTCFADVELRDVEWIWRPYIPRGGLTLLTGDGGYGKSYICCKLAADLSRGHNLPGQEPLPPQRVLMINAEDAMDVVVLPRLMAMGADLTKVHGFDQAFPLDATAARKILAAVHQHDITMIFVDPLVAFLGGALDMNQANQVRSILVNLQQIALTQNIAVVVVHHVNKGQANGQHRTLGSVDFTNGVRSQLLVDRSNSGWHHVAHVKCNWAPLGPKVGYRFDDRSLTWTGILPASDGNIKEPSLTPRGKAAAFIKNVLREGPVPAAEIIALARDNHMTESSLDRAKVGLVRSWRDGKKNIWYWELLRELHPKGDGTYTFGKSVITKAQADGEMEKIIAEAQKRTVHGGQDSRPA